MEEEFSLVDNLYSLKTNKYKTISLYLNYAYHYDLKRRMALSALSYFLGRYTNTYNSKDKMRKVKDNLYGISISSEVRSRANLLLFFIKITFINPKFLKDVSSENYLMFIKECFNDIYFSEDLLKEFKKTYKDSVSRKLDNPNTLSINRIYQILSKESSKLEVYNSDHRDIIDTLTLDDVKEVYEELKTKFSITTFIVGDYDEKTYNFLKSFKSSNEYYLNNSLTDIKDIGEIVEDKNVSQSILSVVYKTPFNRTSKDFYSYMLGNCLLGMVPTSLLFEEVREKLSLCYYISITDLKNEGLVKIFTAIDGKNKDTVLKQIDIQINRLINKDYDIEKLELARTLLVESIKATEDDFDSYVDFIYSVKLNKIDCTLDSYIDNLYKVTADDISNVFKEYKHVLTYMLNGVKHE